ncbi:MAG TPA: transglycosylase SLT domain-containing protein [Pyrinomonadaceae bacterium]|nr:transglycosylase SLT domain-containing protein [Pyrinomonadaceae bacterium]
MLKNLVAFLICLLGALPSTAANRNSPVIAKQAASETTLAAVRRSDAADRDAKGNLKKLAPAEHMRRAAVYLSVRAFEEARAHWQTLIDNYPQDPRVPEAMLGIGRSYFLSKDYQPGYAIFNQIVQDYNGTKESREALNFSAASLLRMGRFAESAARYAEYVDRYPNGERIDTAHLNVIDTLREANKPAEALQWVARTRQRFAGTAAETNAMFAELRLYVAEDRWSDAVNIADQLLKRSFSRAVLTSQAEVAYLKAFSLEKAGRKNEAFNAYLSVPDSIESYYGWLATQRLDDLARPSRTQIVSQREERVNSAMDSVAELYPAPYRQAILNASKSRKLDPRFILALIRQESVFKPLAKSPAGARGLLQLTMDAAQKYGPGAGLNALRENQLYQPETSITVGAEYIEHLTKLFPQMLEPVAASYNGGEDNVARWLERAGRPDPGVFTAEVGFDETKGYVQKVMSNYRVYKRLYTADLIRK